MEGWGLFRWPGGWRWVEVGWWRWVGGGGREGSWTARYLSPNSAVAAFSCNVRLRGFNCRSSKPTRSESNPPFGSRMDGLAPISPQPVVAPDDTTLTFTPDAALPPLGAIGAAVLPSQSKLRIMVQHNGEDDAEEIHGDNDESMDSPDSPDNDSPEGHWKKHVWTVAEDAKLLSLVQGQGKVRWSMVGASMEGRSGKQCRERWHNHLSPDVNKSKWGPEEDRAIVEAVNLYGTRWSEIVKMFPGR